MHQDDVLERTDSGQLNTDDVLEGTDNGQLNMDILVIIVCS